MKLRVFSTQSEAILVIRGLIQNSRFFRQAGIMTLAQGFGMFMAATGAVWTARCLGPKNLGISGMIQNSILMASLLLGLIQPPVLVREYKNLTNDDSRIQLIQSSTTFRITMAVIFSTIWASFMAFHLIPVEYRFAGWFFIPLLLFGGTLPTWIFQANNKQHLLSMLTALQYSVATGMFFWLLRPGMDAGTDLAIQSAVAFLVLPVYLFVMVRVVPSGKSFRVFHSLKHGGELIRKSRWLFFSAFTTYVCATFEQPLLGWLYSLEELGRYRTAVSVASVIQVFFFIILDLLYPRFLEWRALGEEILWRRQLKLISFFSITGILCVIVAFIITPRIYPILFGKDFVAAAIPCAILLSSKFVSLPAGILLFGLMTHQSHDKSIFICTLLVAIGTTTVNVFLIPRFGSFVASLTSLSVQISLFLLYFFISYRHILIYRSSRAVQI